MSNKSNECVYFELNHWSTEFYPDAEPFISWMSDYYEAREEEKKSWIREPEILNEYCKSNQLVMIVTLIDMSVNFCVTAKRSWVEENCPELLTKYHEFIRKADTDEELPYGQFDCPFLEYKEENIGVHYLVENDNGEYVEYKNEISKILTI